LWGSLAGCVPVANRHARRLPIAAQDTILPHSVVTVRGSRKRRRERIAARTSKTEAVEIERGEGRFQCVGYGKRFANGSVFPVPKHAGTAKATPFARR
jgi:hypothetical protein